MYIYKISSVKEKQQLKRIKHKKKKQKDKLCSASRILIGVFVQKSYRVKSKFKLYI